jgi:type IV fimbrial biogenesis protein FimU
MRYGSKGFSLFELLVTLAIVGILAAVAVPSFRTAMQNTQADTEVADLQRAFNFARLEAINRGVNVVIAPVNGATWSSQLRIMLQTESVKTQPAVLRLIAAMSNGAVVNVPANVTAVEFNNLGGLTVPSAQVTFAYARGPTISRTLNVCLSGRIILGGGC